ncbi:MAG: cell division protein FtsL [Gammaproteobacteria bacterium]|jgi:cell division protein FtsL|nr:cell division protein FtsL [Gammaproteobacteria bacterium]MBT3966223.1 cell division protein FtsL [Gammaproteobacteria bacterium]MBT4081340.1 cell division protein FtsL [Gammaproteobacteria bacterium]MBT4331148.1 cell division protein FtsL [Gammaproteobacteria bacterium]MBT5635482.1 cell division protein FtsL [Gammaproteobacteria bacterium]
MKSWYETDPLFRGFAVTLMVLVVVVSAVSVSYQEHREVQLYRTLQGLKKQYEKSLEEQGRLRLEEAAWGNLAKIEDRARAELKMQYPERTQRIVVRR